VFGWKVFQRAQDQHNLAQAARISNYRGRGGQQSAQFTGGHSQGADAANGSSNLAPQGGMSQAAEANPQVITAETNRESFDSSAMDAPNAVAETFEVRCRVTLDPCSATDSYDGLLRGADLYETSDNINPLTPQVKVRSTNPSGRRPPLTPFSTDPVRMY
jgi:hypothetical protein